MQVFRTKECLKTIEAFRPRFCHSKATPPSESNIQVGHDGQINRIGVNHLYYLRNYDPCATKYRNFKVEYVQDETLREGCERSSFDIDDERKFELLKAMVDTGLRHFFIGIGAKNQNSFVKKCLEAKLDKGILPEDTYFTFITLLNSWSETFENLNQLPQYYKTDLGISFGMIEMQSKNHLFEKVHEKFAESGFKTFRVSTLNYFPNGLSDEMYNRTTEQVLRCAKININTVRINDSVGSLYPEDTAVLCQNLTRDFRDTNFCLHTHNDRGLSLANALVSIQNGFNMIEGSLAGLGNRSGITPIDLVVKICQEKNIDLGKCKIDRTKLRQASQLAEEVFLTVPNVFRPDSGIFANKVNMGETNIPDYLGVPGERSYVLHPDGINKGNIKSILLKQGFDKELLESSHFIETVRKTVVEMFAERNHAAKLLYTETMKSIHDLQTIGNIDQKDILHAAVLAMQRMKNYPSSDEKDH